MNLPKAKTGNIVVQNLDGETLIYDLTTNQAFCLNETASKVFNACDGVTTFDELKVGLHYTDEIICLALDGLWKESLIESDYVSPFAGLSRREMIRKAGSASMVALPIVSSLVAPHASQAATFCQTTNTCLCLSRTPFGSTCGVGAGPRSSFGNCNPSCLCRVNFPGCANSPAGGFCTGDCV